MELAYLLNPAFQYENRNGKPLTGGFLKVFEHGTTIPYITWKNFDGDRNPAEIPLNDLGMAVVLVEPGKLYDIFCYDINRVEQWSRVNVGTYGGAGGASGGASGSGVSAIRCTGLSRLATDGNFRYSVQEATGSALEVSSGVLTADAAWYHYDATVRLIWESEPLNRETQVKLAAYLNDDLASDVTSFDMGYTHDGTVRVSGEVKVTADDTVFNITVTGMPAGMEAQLVDFGMHTVNAQGGSGGSSDGVTDVLQNGSSVVDNGVAWVTVPTKTSDLQNDSGFITDADIPAIPTKTSDLQNDSGFVTAGDIRQLPASTSADSGEVLTVDSQGNPGWAQLPSPVVSGVQDVKVDGVSVVTQGVAEITMPSVPTKTSQLQNDSGFVTSSAIPTKTSDLQNDSGFITSSSLPTVDQTYNAASTNAQSGVAVAQAIAGITPGGGGASFYAPPIAFTQTTSDVNVSTTRMKPEYAAQLQAFMNANKGKYFSVTAYAKHAYGTGQEPDGVFINFLSTIYYSTGVARDYHATYAIRCASSLNVAYSNVTGSASQVLGPLATEEMTTVSVVNTVTKTAQQSLHYTIYAMLFQIVG